MTARRLRLLLHPPASGALNMAVDEALLDSDAGPTLRVYRWRRPTVSLGYAQPWRDAFDRARVSEYGLDVVRRPTGGRAVLHADEITYSLTGPSIDGSVLRVYRLLAAGLATGLRALGADVELERSARPDGGSAGAACFASRARHEVVVAGKKLIGSAQRRRGNRLLQHGSMPLGRPDPRLWSALGNGHRHALAATVGLAEALGRRPARREVAAALADGIGAALGLESRVGALTAAERRAAARLERRHRSPGWIRLR